MSLIYPPPPPPPPAAPPPPPPPTAIILMLPGEFVALKVPDDVRYVNFAAPLEINVEVWFPVYVYSNNDAWQVPFVRL